MIGLRNRGSRDPTGGIDPEDEYRRVRFLCCEDYENFESYSPAVYLRCGGGRGAFDTIRKAAPFLRPGDSGSSAAGLCGFLFNDIGYGSETGGTMSLDPSQREAVEAHFREVHLPNIIKQVEKHTMSGPASRQIRSPGLQRLMRAAWDEQKRFPLQIATVLSQQFAAHGLQFFKVNKTITHVSVARPHYLDMDVTPVSEQVKKIVDFINATPKCTRRALVEHLAPTPPPA